MKTFAIILLTFIFIDCVHSQEIFIYGEGGTKKYFQIIDSLVQVRFNENASINEKLSVAKQINPAPPRLRQWHPCGSTRGKLLRICNAFKIIHQSELLLKKQKIRNSTYKKRVVLRFYISR